MVERRVRILALEGVDTVAPQVNRVQEGRSSSLDVGELNENIEKLTKLLIVGQRYPYLAVISMIV